MNRIDVTFKALRKRKRKALVAFVTYGDPTPKVTERLALEFQNQGVDLLELGFPFSDPIADGPVIQRASLRALKHSVTLKNLFRSVKSLRKKGFLIPVILLSYYNPIFRYGEARFVKEAKENGLDGVVIPDLPIEESSPLLRHGRKRRFHLIFLVAPTSDAKRRRRIVQAAKGFIYYVSVTGTTGIRKHLPKDLTKDVRSLKRMTPFPVCVGFGVSTPEEAHRISRVADGVIVGSAIVRKIEEGMKERGLVERVGRFVSSLKKEVHR
ncbi:MAG: tryptophan synthase subunit alpha [Candidatus Omnitrophica bacterium]|nr:tryptophan synthase subunit alpha [Candidatus Omnitrophota bacterium]